MFASIRILRLLGSALFPASSRIAMKKIPGRWFGAVTVLVLFQAANARDPEERFLSPPPGPTPIVVRAAFDLGDVNAINDEEETVEFVGVITLEWEDPRQAFDPTEAGVAEKLYHGDFQFNEASPAWYPQVFLVNESGTYDSRGVLLRVKPDGRSTLVTPVNAVAEVDLDMRHYPFDAHALELCFGVVGFRADEVMFEALPAATPEDRISQWSLVEVATSTALRQSSAGPSPEFVVTLHVERESIFILRLVWLPLILIVGLSWSVFWMDRSSLGDRLNVSFVGILTAVAYQLVIGDVLPHISYLTMMHAFINLSFFTMCAGVVMNLIVAAHERDGRAEVGDRIDLRCRWLFPLSYGLLLGLSKLLVLILAAND